MRPGARPCPARGGAAYMSRAYVSRAVGPERVRGRRGMRRPLTRGSGGGSAAVGGDRTPVVGHVEEVVASRHGHRAGGDDAVVVVADVLSATVVLRGAIFAMYHT